MNPIKEFYDEQKKDVVEYSELFLSIHKSVMKVFEKYSPISDHYFLDGYFVFYRGDNSICHFKLATRPEWKFGIWLNYVDGTDDNGDKNPDKDSVNVQIFAQVEKFIDKFKPTRSAFGTEFNLYKKVKINDETSEVTRLDVFNLDIPDYEIKSMSLIWKNPYLAMYSDIFSVDFNEEYVTPLVAFIKVKREFIKDRMVESKKIRATKFLTRKLTKWFNKNLKKEFGKFEFSISDRGEGVSPRYHPKPVIFENCSNGKLEEFDYQYNKYKDKLRKRFGEKPWVYDKFGWVEWFEASEDPEELDQEDIIEDSGTENDTTIQ